jgi:hypothetical protein
MDNTRRYRYADRVQAVADGSLAFHIFIDSQLRFRLERDDSWPAQWRLYPITHGVREIRCVAIENEHWDIIDQLERGVYWMPATHIEHKSPRGARFATYIRYPEYLDER